MKLLNLSFLYPSDHRPSGIIGEYLHSPRFWVDRLESLSVISPEEGESWQLFTVSDDNPVEVTSFDSFQPACFGSSESYQLPFPGDTYYQLSNAVSIHAGRHRTIQLEYPYIWQYWVSGQEIDPLVSGLRSQLEGLRDDLESSISQAERFYDRLSAVYSDALSLYGLRHHIEAGEHWCNN